MKDKRGTNKIILLFIALSIILVLCYIIAYMFLFKDSTKEVIQREDWDNRVYPLTILFYSLDHGGTCYKTLDNTCLIVNNNSDHYDRGKLDNKYLLGEYKCKTNTCFYKDVDYDQKVAIIIDGHAKVFDFDANKVYDTKISESNNNNAIKLLSVNGKGDYDISVYIGTYASSSSGSYGEVYNTKIDNYLFNEWYLIYAYKFGDYYYINNYSERKLHIRDINGKDLAIIPFIADDKPFYPFELDDYVILSRDNLVVLKKDDVSKQVTLKGSNIKKLDNYLITSGKQNGNNLVYIYDPDSLELLKTIDSANDLQKISVNNNTFYVAKLGYDIYSATKVLDKDFNPIIDVNNLPTTYKHYNGGKYVENKNEDGYFNPNFNSLNNTIAIWLDKIYVYNYNGDLVRTIDHENIIGATKNYFVVQDNKDLKVYNYDDELVTIIATLGEGEKVHNVGYGDFIAHIGSINNNFHIFIVNEDNYCVKYTYTSSDKTIKKAKEACSNY